MGGLDSVHAFVSSGRFRSFDEMREFGEERYTEDGDGIPSLFTVEVGLTGYEPGCIECVHRSVPVALAELLAGASYSDQWLHLLPASIKADSAICVFAPNRVQRPRNASIEYIGAFGYRVVHPDWIERLCQG